MRFSLFPLTISNKILLCFALSTFLAISVTGLYSYIGAQKAIRYEAEQKLTSVVHGRHTALLAWLESIDGDLSTQAHNPTIQNALLQFSGAWNSLKEDQENTLQRLYITDNPHPTGQKEALDRADDGSLYSSLHAKYHPYIRRFLRDRGYYDVFLFDPDGNLVYSVYKELDYATNLNTGKWANTDLGNAFKAADASREPGFTAFFDFRPYAPSFGAPASFISTPMFDKRGKYIGVLAFQMPIERLNALMKQSAGLGNTGEVFLVGTDMLMRSDLRLSEESTFLQKTIDTQQVRDALAGIDGLIDGYNYRDTQVLAAYLALEFHGVVWAVIAEINFDEALALISDLRLKLIFGALFGIVAFGFGGYLFGRGLSRPIVQMTTAMSELAEGKLDSDIPGTERGDEIGRMALALEVFKQTAVDKVKMDLRASDEIAKRAEQSAAEVEKNQAIQIEIDQVVSAAVAGDFSRRVEIDGLDGTLQNLGCGMNELLTTVENGLTETVVMMSALAEGNLTKRMIGDYQGSFLQLKEDSNHMAEKISEIVGNISTATSSVRTSTDQISTGAHDLATRAESQAASLQETAAAMEQISATVKTNAENVGDANNLAESTRARAEDGRQVVLETVQAMADIRESAAEIGDIVSTIEAIAFQTNLLALNAAVEAARAGDAGKGFAVVASEVRTLAQRSGDAAKTIKTLIDKSTEHVAAGDRLVADTDKALSLIHEDVLSVASKIGEITNANSEQSTGVEEVSVTVNHLDQITQENATLADRSAAAARTLKQESQMLGDLIAFFKFSPANFADETGATANPGQAWEDDAQADVKGADTSQANQTPQAPEVPRSAAGGC